MIVLGLTSSIRKSITPASNPAPSAEVVPFPNSSRMMRDWEVAPRKASETWARSIMNADAGYSSAHADGDNDEADLGCGFPSLDSGVYCH